MKNVLLLALLGFFVQGCAGVTSRPLIPYAAGCNTKLMVTVNKAANVEIPDEYFKKIQAQIEQGLAQRRRLAEANDDKYDSAAVTITSFRMRPDAARLAVGILAGCDNIKSNISVVDNGKEVGSADVSIQECAAWGVADQVIGKYTGGVVDFLTGGQ
jgi:hypothetical protein